MIRMFRAKIDSVLLASSGDLSGLYLYGWTQQDHDRLTALDADAAAPLLGTVTNSTTYSNPALELNNALAAVDSIVWMRERGYVNGQMFYEFDMAAGSMGAVTGTGTDNHVVRWNGTGVPVIQDSFSQISDAGIVTVAGSTTPGAGDARITLTPTAPGGTQRATIGLAQSSTVGMSMWFEGGDFRIQGSASFPFQLRAGDNPAGTGFVPIIWDFDPSVNVDVVTVRAGKFAITPGGAGFDGLGDLGVTGIITPGPGFKVRGGLVVDAGSGSFVGTASANTFTAPQTFESTAVGQTPVTIQGDTGQTADLLSIKDDTGTPLVTVAADGAVTAPEFNGDGTNLTGVIHPADTGTTGHKIPYLDGVNFWSESQRFTQDGSILTGAGTFEYSGAETNTSAVALWQIHDTSATPLAGFGLSTPVMLAADGAADPVIAHVQQVTWLDPDAADRKPRVRNMLYGTAANPDYLRAEYDGTDVKIGFLGATAVARQSGDAATGLVNLGLFSSVNTIGTVTSVDLTAPAAGITVSGGPITGSGSITLALADDLAALEALSGTNTIYYRSAANTWTAVTIGSGLTFTAGTLTATGGGGTVTSVALTVPSFLSVSGSPVTTSGTLAVTLATQTQRTFFAGPTSGSPAAPVFRALDYQDVPLITTFPNVTPAAGDELLGYDDSGAVNAHFHLEDLITAVGTRGYIDGHVITYTNGTTVSVGVGVCRDAGDAYTMRLASALSKTTSSWSAGTGNGALDTGTVAAATWYHVYVIGKTDGTTDVLFSTSATSPTMPTGYTLKRRIGSIKTGGGATLIPFFQTGDDFYWSTPVLDVNAANNPGTSAVTRTLTVPTGVKVKAILGVTAQGNAGYPAAVYFSDLSLNDTTAGAGTASSFHVYNGLTAIVGSPIVVWTNTSAQVRSRLQLSDASTYIWILTEGWTDPRGRAIA